MFRNGLVFWLIAALILIGVVAAGGYMVYKAGVSEGVAQAPAVATAISRRALLEDDASKTLALYAAQIDERVIVVGFKGTFTNSRPLARGKPLRLLAQVGDWELFTNQ